MTSLCNRRMPMQMYVISATRMEAMMWYEWMLLGGGVAYLLLAVECAITGKRIR